MKLHLAPVTTPATDATIYDGVPACGWKSSRVNPMMTTDEDRVTCERCLNVMFDRKYTTAAARHRAHPRGADPCQ